MPLWKSSTEWIWECGVTASSCHTKTCHTLLPGTTKPKHNSTAVSAETGSWLYTAKDTSRMHETFINICTNQPFLLETARVIFRCNMFWVKKVLCFCTPCNKGMNVSKQSAWLSYLRPGFISWSCIWSGLWNKNTEYGFKVNKVSTSCPLLHVTVDFFNIKPRSNWFPNLNQGFECLNIAIIKQ